MTTTDPGIARSSGYLTDPIRTRAAIPNIDGALLTLAQVAAWDLYAFFAEGDRHFYREVGRAASVVIKEPPIAWDEDAIGCNFEHWLFFGQSGFQPRGGGIIRLEFRVYRTHDDFPGQLFPETFVHVRTLEPTRRRVTG